MAVIHDYLAAYDTVPTDVLRHTAAAAISAYLYVYGEHLRAEDPETYRRAQAAMAWHIRTMMALLQPSDACPAPPRGAAVELTICHRDDPDTAGFAYTVRFEDRALPALHGSTTSLRQLHALIDAYFAPPRTPRRADGRRLGHECRGT